MADRKRRKLVPRKKGSLSIFNNLTDELLSEILIRLPSSKQAIRCKLVCKRWFSLVSSDYFVTASTFYHRDKEVKTILPFTFVVLLLGRQYNTSIADVDYIECPKPKRGLDLGFLLKDKLLCLEASYGDLILCSSAGRRNNYTICNTLTRQSIILPPSPSGEDISGRCMGLMINEPNSMDNNAPYEYRVSQYFPRNGRKIKGQIFSSEQGRWTQLILTSPRTLDCFGEYTRNSLIACGRMLYLTPPAKDFVLAFDPFNTNDQILHIIDLPPVPPYSYTIYNVSSVPAVYRRRLGVCRGRLRFAQVTFNICPAIYVWELEDYKMGKWTLVHQTTPRFTSYQPACFDTFYVLAFHPNNEDLVCCRAGTHRVVVFNLQTNKVESFIRPRIFKSENSEVLASSERTPQVLPITQKWWPTPLRDSL